MGLLLRRYLRARWIEILVVLYVISSVIGAAFFAVDFTLPCLFRRLFSVRCPGCGLTGAAVALAHLDPVRAWDKNPLIFVVLPAAIYFVVSSVRQQARQLEQDR